MAVLSDKNKDEYYNSLFQKRPDEDRDKMKFKACKLTHTPAPCQCSWKSLFCENRKLQRLPQSLPTDVKELDLSGNDLHEIDYSNFTNLLYLQILIFNNAGISTLGEMVFHKFRNLQYLYLNGNRLRMIKDGTFLGNSALRFLYLSFNPIQNLDDGAFVGLDNLEGLFLRHCSLATVTSVTFKPLKKLRSLWLDENSLVTLPDGAFQYLMQLETLSLSRNNLINVDGKTLLGLWKLKTLYLTSNSLTYLKEKNFGNLTSLLTLDLQDNQIYTVEVKAFVLLEKLNSLYLSIVYPLMLRRRTMIFAGTLVASSWLAAAVIAIVPIFNLGYFGDEYYGNNGVCLPLQIHDPFSKGWQYSMAIFCGLNSVAFGFICYAYITMFITISRSKLGLRSSQQQQDRTIAKRFSFIVATDLLCWLPIIVIKTLAISGVTIYSELYAWVAVFMLPINSALNPILYTLTTKLFKQQLARIVYTWKAGGVQVECQAESSGISMTSAPYNGKWSKNSASISTSDSRVVLDSPSVGAAVLLWCSGNQPSPLILTLAKPYGLPPSITMAPFFAAPSLARPLPSAPSLPACPPLSWLRCGPFCLPWAFLSCPFSIPSSPLSPPAGACSCLFTPARPAPIILAAADLREKLVIGPQHQQIVSNIRQQSCIGSLQLAIPFHLHSVPEQLLLVPHPHIKYFYSVVLQCDLTRISC
ncbi:Relaxin receptor 1 like protein [Argiope bruennichi]|uniref:Relaxin receptor 1 like protein n=1 Tax=Argiope bruennichi TaxID=94029 RepID=A0A8T0ERA8_ARGBR|nr:Relaxin receptor 1 like protein [Argiope bruennichi]